MKKVKVLASAAVLMMAAAVAHANGVTYSVLADTSSLAGTLGWLDFQLVPGTGQYAEVTATLKNFDGGTGGLDAWNRGSTGSVVGHELDWFCPGCPDLYFGPVYFDDGTAPPVNSTNDYWQMFSYGDYISFDVELDWTQPGYQVDTGSAFIFEMADSDWNPLLLSPSAPGFWYSEMDVFPDGTTAQFVYPAASSTPEPTTFLTAGSLLLLAVFVRKRNPAR